MTGSRRADPTLLLSLLLLFKGFLFFRQTDKIQIRKLFDQDQHILLDPEKSGHLWQ